MMNRIFVCLAIVIGVLTSSVAVAQTLSEGTYRRLTRIHDAIGEEKYAEALDKLDKLLPSTKYSPYETAMVLQTYGFVYAQQGQYDKAADYFLKAIGTGALPQQQIDNMKYNLGQFHIAVGEYRKGIKVLEEYFASTKNPVPPESRVLLATAYAQIQEFRKALPPLTQALTEATDPKESWFQLKLALHYELNDYPSCAKTLLEMIARFPVKQDYWKQLSGIYLELKKDADALAIMALADRRNFIDEEKEIVNLTNLFMYLDIPYKAAKTIEHGIASGAVAKTAKNYELLSNAWLASKEYTKAIDALEEVAKRTDNGDLVLRLAYLYVERENWKRVLPTLERAQELGVKKIYDVALLKGIAASELGRYDVAEAAFREAAKDDGLRETASAWVQHVLEEKRAAEMDREDASPADGAEQAPAGNSAS